MSASGRLASTSIATAVTSSWLEGLLRQLLGRYAGRAPEQIEFCYGPQGKPALAGESDLQFNIAHSHGTGLFAFTRSAPIGVDAEQIRSIEHEALAARFFSAAECAAFMRVPAEGRDHAFYTYGRGRRRTSRRSAAD